METKVCIECNKDLPLSEYYIVKKTGYQYRYCKKCHYKKTKPIAKQWRKENPERWINDVKKAHKAWNSRQDGGVYLLVTTDGLYIGQSNNLKLRLRQHEDGHPIGIEQVKNTKLLYSSVLEIENDPDKRLRIEKRYIKKLKPELNLEHNPNFTRTGSKLRNKYMNKK